MDDILSKARYNLSMLVKGYRYGHKIRQARQLGLDSPILLAHFAEFAEIKISRLKQRARLLMEILPHLKDSDLLESKAIFGNSLKFNLYYVSFESVNCKIEVLAQVVGLSARSSTKSAIEFEVHFHEMSSENTSGRLTHQFLLSGLTHV